MEDIRDASVGPLKFDTLSENLAKADKNSLSKINLNTANVAEKAFTSLDKQYRLHLGKRLDATQIKIANQWLESAKTKVEGLKPKQVLFQAIQKTLQDESESLQAKITRNQERWENPGFFRKLFCDVEQKREETLQKLQSETETLTTRITTFKREITKFNETASDTAKKITASWTDCQRQIQLYGQARDTLVATSQLLKSTSSKLSDYDPATQKALSPKLDQLQTLQERLAQVKAKRTDRGLDLSQDKVFNRENKEMKRLSEMLTTLTKEIQTILDTSPKLTKMEKITHCFECFKSVFSSRSTVPAEKEALLSALKEPQKQPISDSASAKGKASILGRSSSAQAKSPSDLIQKTIENSPQAVVAALQILIARCEVEPTNTTSKKELMTLLDAIQTHKQISAVFKGHPSLRDRIAAAKLYELQDTDTEFLRGEKTLTEKLSHIQDNIKLWQCEPELIKLAQTKSEATAKTLAQPNLAITVMQSLPEKSQTNLSKLAQEIQTTEQTFFKELIDYRLLASKLLTEPDTPQQVKAVCQDVVNQLSFIDTQPLLNGTDKLEGAALLQKLLENISGPEMQSQMARIGDLCQTKFTTTNSTILQKYLNDQGKTSEALRVPAMAITGAQRNPRYELLLQEIAKQVNGSDELSKNLKNNITTLLETMKFHMSITNRKIV